MCSDGTRINLHVANHKTKAFIDIEFQILSNKTVLGLCAKHNRYIRLRGAEKNEKDTGPSIRNQIIRYKILFQRTIIGRRNTDPKTTVCHSHIFLLQSHVSFFRYSYLLLAQVRSIWCLSRTKLMFTYLSR